LLTSKPNKKTFMKTLALIALVSISFSLKAQVNLNKVKDKVNQTVSGTGTSTPLSNTEIVNGLKEALSIGANNSASSASKTDGFFKNQKIRIPFPPEAARVRTAAENVGMKKQVDKFVLTLNRAAEEASKEAAPIFLNAIKTMSISDGMSLLKGSDNAATEFLNNRTNPELRAKFQPIVKAAIQKVELTKYWNPLMSNYNKVPGVQRVNPNLEEYITIKAIEGLFTLMAEEELKIRKDPGARVTDLLRRVFGG
jgi:hypothetical protein